MNEIWIWVIIIGIGVGLLLIMGAYMHHKAAEAFKRLESGLCGCFISLIFILVIALVIYFG